MRITIIILIIIGIFISLFIIVLPVETCEASGNTIYVGGTGHGNYTKVQDGINAANPGDTVYVYSGAYNENIVINKSITLISESKENTIIKGAASGHVIKITADFVNISSFNIQDAIGEGYDSIMMDKVQNCRIIDNIIKNSDDGVYLLDSHWNIISDNIIQDNDINGIFASFSDNNIFKNNKIYYNQKGIVIGSYSDSNEIFDNNIEGEKVYLQGIGIDIGTSTTENLVYRNYLDDFDDNAKDLGTGNTWYNSSTQEGNYWDDYTGKDDDNGRGDIPYNINDDASVQDIYPLGYFQSGSQDPIISININPNPATHGQTVYFNGHVIYDGTILDWEWSSSINGVLSHLEDFTYSGLSIGTHTISLRVEDDDGYWSEPDTKTLVINPQNQKPTATNVIVNPKSALYGEEVYLYGVGMDYDGIVTGWNWRSNLDGFLSGESSFTTSNLSVGTHIIYFKVRDNKGEWSNEILIRNVIISGSSASNEPPNADSGGPYLGYENTAISFNGSESTDDGTIVSYIWDFGDGANGSSASPTHIYVRSGNYTVTLTVTDNSGKTDTDTTYANARPNNQNGNSENGVETPGFKILFVFIAVTFILLCKRKNISLGKRFK